MTEQFKDRLLFFLIGLIIGGVLAMFGGVVVYKVLKGASLPKLHMPKLPGGSDKASNLPKDDFSLSFERASDKDVFKPSGSTTFEIADVNTTHGNRSLLVKIKPGAPYPGLEWEVFGRHAQNWSGRDNFQFDVYNNTEQRINLIIKMKSGKDYPKKTFSQGVSLEPLAMNNIRIPMQSVGQMCDLSQMSYVKIFMEKAHQPVVLYFDSVGIRPPGKDEAAAGTMVAVKTAAGPKQEEKVLKEGFDVFAASSLDRIFRDGNTLVEPQFTDKPSIALAQNEYESFQVVVNNGRDPLKGVHLQVTDFIHQTSGKRVTADSFSWRVVGYVPTEKPYYAVKYIGLWPDPLMPPEPVDVKPGATQPFWVTVQTPKDAPPGMYKGKVILMAQGQAPREIPVTMRVYDFSLPRESHLTTAFDFYGHITFHRYPQRKNESKNQYNQRLEGLNHRFITTMLQYRMNPILNVDPTKTSDLQKVDKYRWFGLNRFAIGKKGGTFNNNWPKEDAKLEALLTTYRTYGEMLALNKMLDMQYIYTWDEGEIGNPMVAKVAGMIHRAHPKLKNMVCYHGIWNPDQHPGWGKDIDIWTVHIDNFNAKALQKLKDLGMDIWFYISGPGSTGAPNLALDFDSTDYRIVPWLAWKYDLKGFLYWCVNWWPYRDPFLTANNTKWNQNGNGMLFYPGEDGPVASLRAELYRDGMEDYEYFILLRDKLRIFRQMGLDKEFRDDYQKAQDLLRVDDSIAKSMFNFTKDGAALSGYRDKVAEMIEKLTDIMTNG